MLCSSILLLYHYLMLYSCCTVQCCAMWCCTILTLTCLVLSYLMWHTEKTGPRAHWGPRFSKDPGFWVLSGSWFPLFRYTLWCYSFCIVLRLPYVMMHFLMLHYFDIALIDVALLNVECSSLSYSTSYCCNSCCFTIYCCTILTLYY